MFKSKHIIFVLLNIFSINKMCNNNSKYQTIEKEVPFMDELRITKKTEPVMFTIRVDKSIVDFYDNLAKETNRSRNELIALALEFAMDKIRIDHLNP